MASALDVLAVWNIRMTGYGQGGGNCRGSDDDVLEGRKDSKQKSLWDMSLCVPRQVVMRMGYESLVECVGVADNPAYR